MHVFLILRIFDKNLNSTFLNFANNLEAEVVISTSYA